MWMVEIGYKNNNSDFDICHEQRQGLEKGYAKTNL